MYKKYIRKNGKLHGPYYYESYRDGDTVKKRYLGARKSYFVQAVIAALVLFFLIGSYYTFTGRTVDDNVPVISEEPAASQGESASDASVPADAGTAPVSGGTSPEISLPPEPAQVGNTPASPSNDPAASQPSSPSAVAESENNTIAGPTVEADNESSATNDSIGGESNETPLNETTSNETREGENATLEVPGNGASLSNVTQNITIPNGTMENETLIGNETLPMNETLNETIVVRPAENASNATLSIGDLNETINETIGNITSVFFLRNFSTLRVAKNGSLRIALRDYVVGATSYEFNLSNITVRFDNDTLILLPDSGFSGVRRGVLVARAGNESAMSNEFSVSVSSGAIRIVTTRERIEVGKPVKWSKNVSLEEPDNITIELPPAASNISVLQINETESEVLEVRSSILTGNAIALSASARHFSFIELLKRFVARLFSSFTGKVIDSSLIENESNITLFLNASANQYVIEYYTQAPSIYEEDIPEGRKIIISGPDEPRYTDVIASTNFSNRVSLDSLPMLHLYWYNNDNATEIVKRAHEVNESAIVDAAPLIPEAVSDGANETATTSIIPVSSQEFLEGAVLAEPLVVNNEDNATVVLLDGTPHISGDAPFILQEIPFDAYDDDEDGNVDGVEWVVPHLSNQTFLLTFSSANTTTTNLTFIRNYSLLQLSSSAPYDSLISYWSFDADGTNLTVYDMTGRNNGTYKKGADIGTTCAYGSCVWYDSDDDLIDVPNSDSLSKQANMTISFWMNYTGKGESNARIMEKYSGTDAANNMSYALVMGTNGRIEFTFNTTTAQVRRATSTNFTLNNQTWYHIVATYNGTAQIYVNGVKESANGIGGILLTTFRNLTIGSRPNGVTNFNGTLDEIMIFNSSLNDSQILDIFKNQSSRFAVSGTQEASQFSILADQNSVNISLSNYLRVMSNISARVGYWNVSSGYNTSDFISPNALIGYWHFDDHFNDSLGNFNATVNGSVRVNVSGVYNQSVTFNSSGFLNETGAMPLLNTTNMTISLWAYIREAKSQTFLAASGGSCNSAHYSLDYNGSNVQFVRIGQLGCTTFTSATSLSTDRWAHIAVTYLFDTGNATFYIDGTNAGSTVSSTSNGAVGTVVDLRIGSGVGQLYSNSSIDELMIFNRTLSASEIQEIALKGRALWSYTSYANLTGNASDTGSENVFFIPRETTNILPSFLLLAGPNSTNPFYTPFFLATSTAPAIIRTRSSNVTVCTGSAGCIYVKNASRSNKAILDTFGNLDVFGSFIENSVGSPDGSDMLFKNSSGTVKAWIDDATGNFRLAGNVTSQAGTACSPPANSFIVKNASGSCVTYIDSSGNLWARGSINSNSTI